MAVLSSGTIYAVWLRAFRSEQRGTEIERQLWNAFNAALIAEQAALRS